MAVTSWKQWRDSLPKADPDKRITRFWSKVEKGPDCWIWKGGVRNQYGAFNLIGPLEYVHRIAYRITVGPIPKGLLVLHRCDTPLCVNPAHLFLGTQSDNLKDANVKGRAKPPDRTGSRGRRKLSDAQIIEMRQLEETGAISLAELGRLYGICKQSIWRFCKDSRFDGEYLGIPR